MSKEEILQQARADYETAADDATAEQRIMVDGVFTPLDDNGLDAGWWVSARVWVSRERIDGEGTSPLPSRFCRLCGADLDGNDPHGATCPHGVTA